MQGIRRPVLLDMTRTLRRMAAVGVFLALALSAPAQQPQATSLPEFATTLKGIERYFVLLDRGDANVRHEKLAMLMAHHGLKLPDADRARLADMAARAYPYVIETLDSRGGYLQLRCAVCETTEFLTYWARPKQSDLVASVSRSCGPVCEDDLTFYALAAGKLAPVEAASVMPVVTRAEFLRDPRNADILDQDPFPLLYHLPRQGTTICIELDGAENLDAFKGSSLSIEWRRGKFHKGSFGSCRAAGVK